MGCYLVFGFTLIHQDPGKMKLIAILFFQILLCFPQFLLSQYFERTYQYDFYNDPRRLLNDQDSDIDYFVTIGDPGAFHKNIYITKIDSTGNEILTKLELAAEPYRFDILPLPDGYIVTVLEFQCDVFSTKIDLFRIKLNGTKVWEEKIDFNTKGAKLLPIDTNSFLVIEEKKNPTIYHLDGTSVSTNLNILPEFKGYQKFTDGSLLIYGEFGIRKYAPYLISFTESLTNTNIIDAVVQQDQSVLALTSKELVKFDSNLSMIKKVDHTIDGDDEMDLTANSSQIFILKRNSGFSLTILNDTLGEKTKSFFVDNVFRPFFIQAYQNRIVVAGNGTNLQEVAIRSMTLDKFNLDSHPDAGVTLIDNNKEAFIQWKPPFPQPGLGIDQKFLVHFPNIKIQIKNFSNSILDKVNINSTIGLNNYICFFYYSYLKNLDSLQLLPNSTKTIDLGSVTFQGRTLDTILPKKFEICFWTTIPNDSLDVNEYNNFICKTFNVTVSNNEIPDPYSQCIVYPNPANEFIQFKGLPESSLHLTITDLLGKKWIESNITSDEDKMDIHSLEVGFYIVHLNNQEGESVLTKKILVQRN